MKAHKAHNIEAGGKIVDINILPDSEAVLDSAVKSRTNNALSSTPKSFSALSALSLQSDLEKKHGGKYASDLDSITRKVRLQHYPTQMFLEPWHQTPFSLILHDMNTWNC